MHMVHDRALAAIDLNLLVVLRALLAERHVTRAAGRVGLSQSATSHALARLAIGVFLVQQSGEVTDALPTVQS